MGSVIAIKLMLYLFCRTSSSDSVQAFAQDHLFDVVTNSVGKATAPPSELSQLSVLAQFGGHWEQGLTQHLLVAVLQG